MHMNRFRHVAMWTLFWGVIFFAHDRGRFLRSPDDVKELLVYAFLMLLCFACTARLRLPCKIYVLDAVILSYLCYGLGNVLLTNVPLIEGLVHWAQLVILYVAGRCLATRTVLTQRALFVMLGVGLLAVSFALLPDNRAPSQFYPIGHISYFSEIVMLLLGGTLYGYFCMRSQTLRLFLATVAVGLLLVLVAAGARANLFAALCAMGVGTLLILRSYGRAVFRLFSWRHAAVFLVITSLCGVLLFSSEMAFREHSVVDRVSGLFTGESANPRAHAFRDTARGALERPLFGWGYGHFRYMYPRFVGPDSRQASIRKRQWVMHSHNEFLNQWFEGGAVGASLYLACIFCCVLFLWRRVRKADPGRGEYGRDLALLCTLLATTISTQLNTAAAHPVVRCMVLILCALAFQRIVAGARVIHVVEWKRWQRAVLSSVVLLCGVVVIGSEVASALLKTSLQYSNRGVRTEYHKVAALINPGSHNVLFYSAAELLRSREFVAAEATLRALVRDFPYDPRGYLQLGGFLADSERLEEASAVLQQGRKVFPDHPRLRKVNRWVGEILERQQQP